MATFLVFEPADGKRTQTAAERVVFLREKFSPWAFIFTPFWLLRYRLWLGFLVWLVAFVAISWIGSWLGFGPYAALAASFFPSALVRHGSDQSSRAQACCETAFATPAS